MPHNEKVPALDDPLMLRRHEVVAEIHRLVESIDGVIETLEDAPALEPDEVTGLDRLRNERERLEQVARDVANAPLYREWVRALDRAILEGRA